MRALRGDAAALGGAVTVALCGHWEHEPPSRWPHHTTSNPYPEEAGSWLVTVRFDASPADESLVRQRITAALAAGALTGPAGDVSTWTLTG